MKNKKKLLKWLVSYRSLSESVEQIKLRNDIQKVYGGEIVNDNLIITKGQSKCAIVAHLDINQRFGNSDLIIHNNTWFSNNNIGCGFDDKAGIAFALDYLENHDNIQVILTIDEEIGCVGAKKVVLDSNIKFLVQLDRRGNSDISEYTNGIKVVSESTKKLLEKTLDKYSYSWQKCVYTDIGEISRNNNIQSVNVSCGYYNEHTANEYLNFDEFINACNFAIEIIDVINRNEVEPLPLPIYNNWNDDSFDSFDVFNDFENFNEVEHEMIQLLENLSIYEIEVLKKILKYY